MWNNVFKRNDESIFDIRSQYFTIQKEIKDQAKSDLGFWDTLQEDSWFTAHAKENSSTMKSDLQSLFVTTLLTTRSIFL